MSTQSAGLAVKSKQPGKRISYLMVWNTKRQSWEFPGGESDGSETPFRTAKRETKEETGINLDSASVRFTIANHDGSHHIYVVDFEFWCTERDSGTSMRHKTFQERKSKKETSDFGFVVKEGPWFIVKNFLQTEEKPNSKIINKCTRQTLSQLLF